MEAGEAVTPDHIAEQWLHDSVIDITDGFPMKSAGEVGDVFFKQFRKHVSRLPVIGSGNRTYMLVVPANEAPEHKTLYDRLELGSSDQIQYTTSIELEGLPADNPWDKDWIHLDDDTFGGYVRVSPGSDYFPKPFTGPGKEIMGNILTSIPGISVSWKQTG